MSSVFFELETLNPNSRTTYFKLKASVEYLAKSEYAIRNKNTTHGLFGRVEQFPNIQDEENLDGIKNFITNLAKDKKPIMRGVISLKEVDATRLGYYNQEKWKSLFENRLPKIAEMLNVKYENLQYVGAVHIEEGHPHFQFMLWYKNEYKRDYFVHYSIKNKLRLQFTNDIFREDLLPIYQEKDFAKKRITTENYLLNQLKNVSNNKKFLEDILLYERNFEQTKFIKHLLKDKEVKQIVDLLIDLKRELRSVSGSIKYQYLTSHPEIIKKVDEISRLIIASSPQCQIEIEKYIQAKQKLLEFQYTDVAKLEEAKEKARQDAEKEIIKMMGNQILDIERKWLISREEYTYTKYKNETRDLLDDILTALYYQAENRKKYNRNFELKFKKQLSKQAKKELAIKKRNASEFEWDELNYD